jgi:hypothetical protein
MQSACRFFFILAVPICLDDKNLRQPCLDYILAARAIRKEKIDC